MGRKLTAATLLLALLGAPAFADDMKPKADTATDGIFTWGGVYVGGYAGGSFGWNGLKNLNRSTDVSLFPGGFTAGGLVGFNYQIDPVVLGVEGEIGVDAWKQSGAFLNGNGNTRNATSEGTYAGRIRARLGYAAADFLFYAAGGVSFADDRVTQTNPDLGVSNSIRKDLVGWNAGVGVEYAFNKNWTGRLEYIYDNYGKSVYDFQSLPGGFANRSVSLERNTIRLGVAYKF